MRSDRTGCLERGHFGLVVCAQVHTCGCSCPTASTVRNRFAESVRWQVFGAVYNVEVYRAAALVRQTCPGSFSGQSSGARGHASGWCQLLLQSRLRFNSRTQSRSGNDTTCGIGHTLDLVATEKRSNAPPGRARLRCRTMETSERVRRCSEALGSDGPLWERLEKAGTRHVD